MLKDLCIYVPEDTDFDSDEIFTWLIISYACIYGVYVHVLTQYLLLHILILLQIPLYLFLYLTVLMGCIQCI